MRSVAAVVLVIGLLTGLGAIPAAAESPADVSSAGLSHEGGRHGVLSREAPALRAGFAASSLAASSADCPAVVTEDTTLTSDCTHISVDADDVVLDLGGHTVTGSIDVWGDGVVVRNGTVMTSGNPHGTAIWIEGDHVVIEDLEVADHGPTFAVEVGYRTTIRNSTFRDNAGVAVSQYYGNDLVVEDSTFSGNRYGVSMQSGNAALIRGSRFEGNTLGVNIWDEDEIGASNAIISSNRFEDNGIGVHVRGVSDAVNTLIERNTFHRSDSSAIVVTTQFGPQDTSYGTPGGAAGTVIRGNVITHSGARAEPVAGCWGSHCEATADDGITVMSLPEVAPTMTVARNKVIKNAGYGIEAPGVSDGGGNVAANNGAGECLGVACR